MSNKKGTLRFSSSNTCGITNEGYLPREILEDILTRLPAKMVGQCKCICKYWRALIEEPSFVELHHFRSKSRPGGCYRVIYLTTGDFQNIHFFSANYEGGLAQPLFTYLKSGSCEVEASVNGLLCWYLEVSESILIMNPTTKELITLPPFTRPANHVRYAGPLVSFGFDPSTKQYKVLNMYHVLKERHGQLEHSHCECEIFTLGTHSWRKIDIVPQASHLEFGSRGVCVGGVIHWRNSWYYSICSRTVDGEVVVAFDLKEERFRVFSLPREFPHTRCLVELGGHLAACEKSFLELPENVPVELWILEDYDNWDWVKERITLPRDIVRPPIYTNGAIQAGEILLHVLLTLLPVSTDMEVYYYGRNKRSLRKIEITGLSLPNPVYKGVFNLVENLVSLRDI
ncbi:hypothetical protein RHGRI_034273 [Rhododendron griersonianum]|uniref:F-box domain-containing protein n=1 Tax=Rhododendron griersonianum TaxID=479676 RepID=A0AAV6I5Q8_9ERIC|nr:hypothetical protein RHGRI_034273 [Rhododendron griersonianum]